MITDEIMQLIYDMQEEINIQIVELNQKYADKEILIGEYTNEMDILEAKQSVLSDVEENLVIIVNTQSHKSLKQREVY